MQAKSLQHYFFKNTALVVGTVMVASTVIFDFAYRSELEQSVYERLKLHIFTLLSVAEFDGETINLPVISYHPQLNTGGSGLWAVVLKEGESGSTWQSLSVERLPESLPLSDAVGEWHYDQISLESVRYLTASFQIALDNNNKITQFNFIVGEDNNLLRESIQGFRFWLLLSFIGFTSILLISQMIALRVSFRPINRLEEEIAQLDRGEKEKVTKAYPTELTGVTNKLNALIEKERNQRNRYRTSMSDLAHSLKTPMAVVRAEISHYQDNPILKQAITRIDDSIEYQLRRAVIGGHNIVAAGIDIEEIINQINTALQKIYSDKHITLTTTIPANSKFMGDENDLMEILGNLMDNAYKFAHTKIAITVEKTNTILTISIEDDGDGLDQLSKETIFNRGARMDEQSLGQGIGLAVVDDIVNSYEGKITTASSSLGGALFRLEFPLERRNNA